MFFNFTQCILELRTYEGCQDDYIIILCVWFWMPPPTQCHSQVRVYRDPLQKKVMILVLTVTRWDPLKKTRISRISTLPSVRNRTRTVTKQPEYGGAACNVWGPNFSNSVGCGTLSPTFGAVLLFVMVIYKVVPWYSIWFFPPAIVWIWWLAECRVLILVMMKTRWWRFSSLKLCWFCLF